MPAPDTNPQQASSYLIKGRIGHAHQLDATVISYALIVTPSQQTVSGQVALSQGQRQLSYSGQVQGTISRTGFNGVAQLVALKGMLKATQDQLNLARHIPFSAHLALDQDWQGTGGIQFGDLNIEHLPVSRE